MLTGCRTLTLILPSWSIIFGSFLIELSPVKRILANDRSAIEELGKLPTTDPSRTPQEALGILRYTHFPGVDIKKELEMVDQLGKIRLSNADWVQDTDHYLAKLVSNFWLF